MSISFSCDFCARKYRVEDALAGKKVKCKECGTELAIPGPSRAMASRSSPSLASPPRDLYGLDDAADEAALPPPPRAGAVPRPSRERHRGSSRGNSGSSNLGALVFAVVALPVLAVMIVVIVRATGVDLSWLHLGGPNPNGAGALPIVQQPAPEAPAPAAGNAPPAAAPNPSSATRIRINGARASAGQGFGGMGVSMEIDYQVEQGEAGGLYELIVKTRRGRTRIVPPVMLMGSGTHRVTMPSLRQEEGPFEVSFEPPGMGMLSSGPASNSMSVSWNNAPPQQGPNPNNGMPPGFGPNRGMMPRPPMGPRGPRFGPR